VAPARSFACGCRWPRNPRPAKDRRARRILAARGSLQATETLMAPDGGDGRASLLAGTILAAPILAAPILAAAMRVDSVLANRAIELIEARHDQPEGLDHLLAQLLESPVAHGHQGLGVALRTTELFDERHQVA
jgi:hypothetical protein